MKACGSRVAVVAAGFAALLLLTAVGAIWWIKQIPPEQSYDSPFILQQRVRFGLISLDEFEASDRALLDGAGPAQAEGVLRRMFRVAPYLDSGYSQSHGAYLTRAKNLFGADVFSAQLRAQDVETQRVVALQMSY